MRALATPGCTTGALALSVPAASASVTIGQVPTTAPSAAKAPQADWLQPTVSGAFTSYVVPAGAGAITSWSTFGALATCSPACGMTLKVFRPGAGSTYSVVAHDGPRTITSGVLNTFSGIDIPVQAGEVIGLNNGGGDPSGDAPVFTTPDMSVQPYLIAAGDASDGASESFFEDTGETDLLNVSAVLAPTSEGGQGSPGGGQGPGTGSGAPAGGSGKSGGNRRACCSVNHVTSAGGSRLGARGGSASVTLSCVGEAPCVVEATLTSRGSRHAAATRRAATPVVLASANATIAAGRSQRVKLKLRPAGVRLLRAHHGRIGALLTVAGKAGAAPIHLSRTVELVGGRRSRR